MTGTPQQLNIDPCRIFNLDMRRSSGDNVKSSTGKVADSQEQMEHPTLEVFNKEAKTMGTCKIEGGRWIRQLRARENIRQWVSVKQDRKRGKVERKGKGKGGREERQGKSQTRD